MTHVDYVRDGAVLSSQNFSLDAANNLSINGSWSFSAGGNHLLSGAPCWNLVYDAEGNLLQQDCGGGTMYFSYDPLGRLTSVTGSVVADYTYDALGQRIAKRVAGVVTRFVWRGGHVVYETDGGGSIQRSYTWGSSTDDLVAIHNHQDGQHYYVVQDLLRSVRGLVRRDGGQGTWVAAWRYRLYGQVLTSDGGVSFPLRFRWAGAQLDEETGLYYLRSRYYSPVFGRFIQEDPIGFAGGANLYAYAGGDPSSGRDPDGLVVGMEPQYHPDPSMFGAADPFTRGGGGSSGWCDGFSIDASGCGGSAWETRVEAWAARVDYQHAVTTLTYQQYKREYDRIAGSGAFDQLAQRWGNTIYEVRALGSREFLDVYRAIRGFEPLLVGAPSPGDNIAAWLGLTNMLGTGRIGVRESLFGAFGEAYYGPGGPFIALGSRFWTPGSRTWRLAHEFGHIWLRTGDDAAANAFACRATGLGC